MLVDVKVHETFVNQIQPGLLAYVTIDSQPEHRYIGTRAPVAPLPDTPAVITIQTSRSIPRKWVIEEADPQSQARVSAHAEIFITNLDQTPSPCLSRR